MSLTAASSTPEISAHSFANERIYAWVPRTEVVFLQAVIDAYEGLARVRTERHESSSQGKDPSTVDKDKDRSLLLFLLQPSRKEEFLDLLHHLSDELSAPVILVGK